MPQAIRQRLFYGHSELRIVPDEHAGPYAHVDRAIRVQQLLVLLEGGVPERDKVRVAVRGLAANDGGGVSCPHYAQVASGSARLQDGSDQGREGGDEGGLNVHAPNVCAHHTRQADLVPARVRVRPERLAARKETVTQSQRVTRVDLTPSEAR